MPPSSADELNRSWFAPQAPAAPAALESDKQANAQRYFNDVLRLASETSDAIAQRLRKIKAADNPLLEAAQPLLLTLASVPDLVLRSEEVPLFHALLVREIETFQMLCTQANLTRDHVISTSFALCTALDEAASGTSWGSNVHASAVLQTGSEEDAVSAAAARMHVTNVGVWAGQMLAAYFHRDTEGGTKIFQLIGRLMTHQPEGHIALLQVFYRLLSLGFEGQYRTVPDGRRLHEEVRQRLYATIAQARAPVPRALSSQWQGVGPGKFKILRSVPVWVTASVLGLALFAQFSWYKYQLLQHTEAVVSQIVAIGNLTPPPAAITVASLRLATLLQEEIALDQLSVIEDEQLSRVVFKGDDMFSAGQADVNAAMLPLLARIAAEIERVAGTVQITGHSDNVPIRTRRFPNNQVLSEQRAASVAAALQAGGVAAEHIAVRGQGERAPLADNATPAGRAQNRRVEIEVTPGAVALPIAVHPSLAPVRDGLAVSAY